MTPEAGEKTTVEVMLQRGAAPEERRTSFELLIEVAEFEQSVGFPLLERHWVRKNYHHINNNSTKDNDTSSERSMSPIMELNVDGQSLDESEHPVLRTWSPVSSPVSIDHTKKKKLVSIPSEVQAPPEA